MLKQMDTRGGRSQRAVACVMLAVLIVLVTACGPGPGNGEPPPAGDAAITVTVVGSGAVEAEGIDFSCRGECTLVVDEGAEVVLSAVPDAQHVSVAWDGPCGALDEQCIWQASDGDTVTMTFDRHALRFDLTGDGEGFFQIGVGSALTECREACGVPVPSPRVVAITYRPEGSTRTTLDPWPETCETAEPNYCLVAVRGAVTVPMTWRHPPLANPNDYVSNQDTLLDVPAVAADPDGPAGVLANDEDTPGDPLRATVETEPEHGSLDLDPDGAFRYQPEPGFSGVDGFTYVVTDAFGNEDVGTVTITVRPRLTLKKDGRGSGTVISDPAGIDCDEACLEDGMHVDAGTSVELTAEPADGSLFEWSGACSGSDRTCTVVVERATSVTAKFLLAPRTLTVGIDGTGSGRVTSDPEGIDLAEGEASSTFDAGLDVTLSAEPAVGSSFTGWTGACEDQVEPTCTITIDDDTTTTATFTLNDYDLITAIDPDGTGSGTVTIDPPDTTIASGDDPITTTHLFGTEVELTAEADVGSTFSGWTGACEDQVEPTCTITIDDDTTITATFTRNVYTLTVTTSGTGSGNVTSVPPGIDTDANDTTMNVAHGDSVTLTATAAEGSTFGGFTGATCEQGSTDTTCILTLTENTTTTATFTLKTYTLTVSTVGSGNVTSVPPGIDTNEQRFMYAFDYGTNVTLTADPDVGSTFSGWAGATCSGTGPCTVTVTEDTTVTATFEPTDPDVGPRGDAADVAAAVSAWR